MRRLLSLFNTIGPIAAAYTIISVIVSAAVPDIIPESAFTKGLGETGAPGVVLVWLFLFYRILLGVEAIYGPGDFVQTPVLRIIADVFLSYFFAILFFAIAYVRLARSDENALFGNFDLGSALYFSVVTITTTGFGDMFPKSALAKAIVSAEIFFGVVYNMLFFSVIAGLAGRRRH